METNKKVVTLAQLIAAHRKNNTKLNALAQQVEDLVTTGGEPNVITAVKVNGTAQTVTDKAVDITVPTAEEISAAATAAIANAAHLKRKKVDSADAIDAAAADADQYIYMVPKAGAKNGDKYDEYMVLDGAVEKVGDWAVDLSGYQSKEDGKGLSTNDYTTAEKEKLAGIEFATDAEVASALEEIYGGGGSVVNPVM